MHDGFFLVFVTDSNRQIYGDYLRSETCGCVFFLLQPRDKEQREKKEERKRFNYKQSVEIGHYGGGML